MGDFFLFIIYFFPFLLMFFGFLLVLFLFFYLFCVYLFYLILVLLVLFVLIYLNVMVYNDIDVIFSFTIACLGIKCDCIPGRCVELLLFCFFSGLFYGQCSELCGVLHGFMPISLFFI